MIEQITETDLQIFASDVDEGLTDENKFLNSRYFYDATGDKLFREIMKLPEYYLTNSEYEIFQTQKDKFLSLCRQGENIFDLIELGAGDGFKTKVLLEYFIEKKVNFKYLPIDISQNALDKLRSDLLNEFPKLDCTPIQGEYFSALEELNKIDSNNKVIFFLGSNIGNFSFDDASQFLKHIFDLLNTGDKMITGFDLKKDPKLVRRAYNDSSGVTRAFNLNLLTRINRELGGHFDLTAFEHEATYNPETGEAKSYLVSLREQVVDIDKLGKSYHFDQWESIFMEVSQKYEMKTIHELAEKSGFKILNDLFDCKHYFVDSIWVKE